MSDWAAAMEKDWDNRARENIMRYIYRNGAHDIESFFATGKYHAIALTYPFIQRLKFDPSGKTVLDIGCGIGRLFPGFRELGFNEIWGIDVSREMVERGREQCPVREANFVLGDGQTLAGLEDESFDYCFSYNMFPCVPDTKIVLDYTSEIERILKPGGAFQLHYRRNYDWKVGMLRILPASLRSPLRSYYHSMLSLRSGRPAGRSLEELYASGSFETWIGAKVSPNQVLARMAKAGFVDTMPSSDPLDSSDGDTFWVSGRKPERRSF